MNQSDVSLELRAISIKTQISIFQSLDFIGVRLLHGPNTQQLICPFHDDTKPSARVYSDSQKIFCFTCHKLWDQITVVMEAKHLSFSDALDLLEDHFKLESPLTNLPLTVKYNVEKRNDSPNLFYLYAYVEERVIDARHRLGLSSYVKLLTVMDVAHYYHLNRRMSDEDYKDTLQKVLAKVPPDASPDTRPGYNDMDVHSGLTLGMDDHPIDGTQN